MKMDEKLNLIIPVPRDSGTFYIHVQPLGREVYENHFLLMARTFSALNSHGISFNTGPKIAGLLLKKEAIAMGVWEGPSGGQGLVNEFIRLSSVAMPGDTGWEQLPLATLLQQKALDEDEVAEVMGAICFFMLASRGYPRSVLKAVFLDITDLWGTQTTSLGIMEWVAALPTSTVPENTGETAVPTL